MDSYQKLVMPKKTKYRLTVVYVPLIDILTVLGFIALGLPIFYLVKKYYNSKV